MDSLALVSFITDLEEKISDEFEKDIVLADEKSYVSKNFTYLEVLKLWQIIFKNF